MRTFRERRGKDENEDSPRSLIIITVAVQVTLKPSQGRVEVLPAIGDVDLHGRLGWVVFSSKGGDEIHFSPKEKIKIFLVLKGVTEDDLADEASDAVKAGSSGISFVSGLLSDWDSDTGTVAFFFGERHGDRSSRAFGSNEASTVGSLIPLIELERHLPDTLGPGITFLRSDPNENVP